MTEHKSRKLTSRSYYLANKERIAESSRKWRANNKEKKRLADRAWVATNKEKVKASKKKWAQANKEKTNSISKKWRDANPEQMKSSQAAWDLANPEKNTQYCNKRRARKVGAGGIFTSEEFIALKNKYGNVCLRCWRSEGFSKLAADHVIPLSVGGSNSIENIQPLCQSCNSSKGTKTIDYRCIA